VGGACGTNGENRTLDRLLVRKPERKRPLGRSRSRWLDKITMDLSEAAFGVVNRKDLAQDRNRWVDLVNRIMIRRVP
jgi:hypothetical protein